MGAPALHKRLPELHQLERVLKAMDGHAKIEVLANLPSRSEAFPLYSVVIGSENPEAPTLGVFGGVHGLERIGSEVVIAWMHTLSESLRWDETLHEKLKRSRIVFMPLINPVGMSQLRRANGNGVDLMRNSPVVAEEAPAFLLGGQTYSNRLPWYRGQVEREDDMEAETKAICETVRKYLFPARVSLAIDVHSGFGTVDRLWFPYAKTIRPLLHLAEVAALKRLLDQSYPNHIYKVEPQSKNYTTHGDIWDYLYDQHLLENENRIFIPWTLELGSWAWLKKNPRQSFSALGAFNPVQPHRLARILRRHITLFDFMHRVVMSPSAWMTLNDDNRRVLTNRAMSLWYDRQTG